MNEEDIEEIVIKTKGYSGSDLMNVYKEVSMVPLRDIKDIIFDFCSFYYWDFESLVTLSYHY